MLVPYVVSSLGVHAGRVGELFAALGVGYLLSAYLGPRACASARLRTTVLALIGLLVVAFGGLFNVHSFAAALVFLALMGLSAGAFLMLERTLLQRRAHDAVIGRISSAYSAVVTAATLAGALIASLIVTWFGRMVTLDLAIGVIASAAVVAIRLPARVDAGQISQRPECLDRRSLDVSRSDGSRLRCRCSARQGVRGSATGPLDGRGIGPSG